MKKIFIIASVSLMLLMFTACKEKGNVNSGFSEETAVETQQTMISTETTLETTEFPTTTSTTAQNNNITFENAKIETNNPIDNHVSSLFGEADTTLKINRASEEFSNLWESEMSNAAKLCDENNVTGYFNGDLAQINSKAQEAYNSVINNTGGSGAYGAAMYESGEVYRQGTYYFIQLYEKSTNKEYKFLYK